MSVELYELAIHFGMELYPMDLVARQRYVDWYIETKGGTEMPIIFEDIARRRMDKEHRGLIE